MTIDLAKLAKQFISSNRAACDWLEERLPEPFTRSLLKAHLLGVLAEISKRSPDARVLDIGGGHQSPFADKLQTEGRPTVIGLDISASQIAANRSIDFGIVADACQGFPLTDRSIDIAVTRSLLEHLPDPGIAVAEIARVLRPNGVCIHVFPSRHSPFAVLNRLMPANLSRWLLFTFFPEWVDSSGFPAFYRHCDAGAMTSLHERAGLKIQSCELKYYQSIYFKFFIPFYLISLFYDFVMYALNIPLFAGQVLLIAEKSATCRGKARDITLLGTGAHRGLSIRS